MRGERASWASVYGRVLDVGAPGASGAQNTKSDAAGLGRGLSQGSAVKTRGAVTESTPRLRRRRPPKALGRRCQCETRVLRLLPGHINGIEKCEVEDHKGRQVSSAALLSDTAPSTATRSSSSGSS